MVSRRDFVKLAVTGVGGLVIGAAGALYVRPETAGTTQTTTQTVTSTSTQNVGGSGTVTQPVTTTATATASQSQTGTQNLGDLGTLVVGVDLSTGDSLDPSFTLDGDAVWIPINNAYQDFLQFQYPDFGYVGSKLLDVTTLSVASDNATWTAKMVGGTPKFANGDPITANDLAYTVNRALTVSANGLAAPYYGFAGITKASQVTALDANTLQIVLPPNYSPSLFRAALCSMVTGVVNKKVAEAHATSNDGGQAWMNAGNSAGSGPFVITEWVKEDHITLVRNDNFWDTPKPKLKKVIFQHVADSNTELTLLQKGSIDVMWDPQPNQVVAQQYQPGYRLSRRQQATSYNLWLNQSVAPFNAGKDVWNAVKWSIDYQGLVNDVLLGDGVVQQTVSWRGLLGEDTSAPYQKNPAMVKQLLTKVGFPNGISFELNYTSFDRLAQLAAPKMQADMADCGITVTLTNVPGSELISKLVAGSFTALMTWEGGGLQHIANNAWWNLDPGFGFFPKWTKWSDPQAISLVAATKTASDADAPAAFRALTQYALGSAPVCPLWQQVKQVLETTNVEGVEVPFSRLNEDYGRAYKQGVAGYTSG